MKHIVPIVTGLLLATACGKSSSKLNATNQFEGKTVGHWYETYNFKAGDAMEFSKLFKDNPETLLGTQYDFLPETLQGLWYMDGNPLQDKTFSITKARAIDTETGDFTWVVGDPLTYSWFESSLAHKMISLITKTNLEYELKWKDCPADVKKEREERYGMADGSCTRDDKEFAVVTPFVKLGILKLRVPQQVSYFDMYLRPKTSDHLVWERRSKIIGGSTIGKIFAPELMKDGFHRYNFTQVIDRNGAKLSSYAKFEADIAALSKGSEPHVFLTCAEGKEGCALSTEAEGQANDLSDAEALDFANIPVM